MQVLIAWHGIANCRQLKIGTVVEVHPRVGLIRVRVMVRIMVRVRVRFRVTVRVRPAGRYQCSLGAPP